MCALNHLHEPAILYNLRRRFMSLLPYTYTGEICIAINPYQWLDIYGKVCTVPHSSTALFLPRLAFVGPRGILSMLQMEAL